MRAISTVSRGINQPPQRRLTRTVGVGMVCFCLAMQARGGDTLHDGPAERLPSDFGLLDASFCEIVVASPMELNAGPYSHGNPPRGLFTIHRVLHGHIRGKSVRMTWNLEQREENYMPWNKSMPEAWRKTYFLRPFSEEWMSAAMVAPKIGEPLIVFAVKDMHPYLSSYTVRAVFRFTDDNVATVLANMGPIDRDPVLQGLLGRTILFFSASSIVMAILFFGVKHLRGWPLVCAGMLSAILSVAFYMVYERGMITGGIRLDLLLIYPAISIGVIAALIVTGVQLYWRRSEPRSDGG